MEPTGAQSCLQPKGAIPVSAIGDFFREIMPNWLSRPVRYGSSGDSFRSRHARSQDPEDARALAVEADRLWEQQVNDGLHGEAFPEPISGKTARSAAARAGGRPKQAEKADKPEKPSGSNRPH
jgi:hypothetical protein